MYFVLFCFLKRTNKQTKKMHFNIQKCMLMKLSIYIVEILEIQINFQVIKVESDRDIRFTH